MEERERLFGFEHLYDLIMDAQSNYVPINRNILYLTQNWSDVLQCRQNKSTGFDLYRNSVELIKNEIIGQSDIIMNENILLLENKQTKNWIVLLFGILIRIFRIIQIENNDSFDIENNFLRISYSPDSEISVTALYFFTECLSKKRCDGSFLVYCFNLQTLLIPIASLKKIKFKTENKIEFVLTFDGKKIVIFYDKIGNEMNTNSENERLLLACNENFELLFKNRSHCINRNNILSMRLLALKTLFIRENNLVKKNKLSHKKIFKFMNKNKEYQSFELIDLSSVIIYSTFFTIKEKNFNKILAILNDDFHQINDIENILIPFFVEDIKNFIEIILKDSSYDMKICRFFAKKIIIFLKKKISLDLRFTCPFFQILRNLCIKLDLYKPITDLYNDLIAVSNNHICYLLGSIRFYRPCKINPNCNCSKLSEALSLCLNIFTMNNIHLSNIFVTITLNDKFFNFIINKNYKRNCQNEISIVFFEFQEKIYQVITNKIVFSKYFGIYQYFINSKDFDRDLISNFFSLFSKIIRRKGHHLESIGKEKETNCSDIDDFNIGFHQSEYHDMLILYIKSAFLLLENYNSNFGIYLTNQFLEIINMAFEIEIQKKCMLHELGSRILSMKRSLVYEEIMLKENILRRYNIMSQKKYNLENNFLFSEIMERNNLDDNKFYDYFQQEIQKRYLFIEISINIFIHFLNEPKNNVEKLFIEKIFNAILKNMLSNFLVLSEIQSRLESYYMQQFFAKIFSDEILFNIFIKTVSKYFDRIYVSLHEIRVLENIEIYENNHFNYPSNIIIFNLLLTQKYSDFILSLENTSKIEIFKKVRTTFTFNIFERIFSIFNKYIEFIPPCLRKRIEKLKFFAGNELNKKYNEVSFLLQ